jgi:PhnB protein
MAKKVKPIPKGYGTVTASLTVGGGVDAIKFYKKAFGATEVMRMLGPGGSIMHAELIIGDTQIMLNDEMPAHNVKSPKSFGGSPVTFFIYVENADVAIKKAVKAGATLAMPPEDMFWGDRMGLVEDPFGHKWHIAHRFADLTVAQMKAGQKEWMKKMAAKQGEPKPAEQATPGA